MTIATKKRILRRAARWPSEGKVYAERQRNREREASIARGHKPWQNSFEACAGGGKRSATSLGWLRRGCDVGVLLVLRKLGLGVLALVKVKLSGMKEAARPLLLAHELLTTGREHVVCGAVEGCRGSRWGGVHGDAVLEDEELERLCGVQMLRY